MSFDPSAIQDIGTQPDYGGAMAKGFQLKDLVDQNQMNTLRLNSLKTEQSDNAKAKSILSSSKLDTEQGLAEASEKLTRAGLPEKAMDLRKYGQSVTSGELDLQKQKVELHVAAQGLITDKVDGIWAAATQMKEAKTPDGRPKYTDAAVNAFISGQIPAMLNDIQSSDLPDPVKKTALSGIQPVLAKAGSSITYDQLSQFEQGSKKGYEMLRQHQQDLLGQRKEQTLEGDLKERTRHDQAIETLQATNPNRTTDTATPEAQALKDELRAKDPTFLSRMSGKGLVELNKTIEDWAKQGKSADDIIAERTGTKEQQATEVAFDKGPQGNAVRAINVGVQHMGVLKDAIVALKNDDNVAFNALRQKYLQLTGSSIPTNFDAAAEFVGNEVSKAGIGAGASGALADREGVKKNLSRSASGEQLAGQMDVYTGLLAGQMSGLERQYKSGKGTHWDDKVAPETKAALDRLKSPGKTTVTSDADYDALPSGTPFVGPDGVTRKKP